VFLGKGEDLRVPVSIRDIAQVADVTPGTVSRALRDSSRVKPETKRRIQRLAEDMGYTPDAQARSLVMGRTETVGLVVTNVADPFIGAIVQTIESAAQERGYTVILTSCDDKPEREMEAVRVLRSRRVDGVIVTSSRVGSLYQKHLDRLRVPVVLINSLVYHTGGYTYSIGVDNHHGAYLATSHLLEKGHRRIAYVSAPPDRSDNTERQRGYRDALNEAGIEADPSLVVQGTGRAGGGQRALPLLLSLDPAPSGVFCYNDVTAMGLIHVAREAGLSLPQDLAIVGFDDIPFARFVHPALTTIAQPVAQLGQGAIEMMLALLSDDAPSEQSVTDVQVRGRLVIRASSG
jgi:DNA-binding LacI/PurR family transcriptional regulator